MAVYEIALTGQPIAGGVVTITAGSAEVRVILVDLWSTSGGTWMYIKRWSGSASGGSTYTPIPLRANAPAAGASIRYGSVSTSGTESRCWTQYMPSGFSVDGSGVTTYTGTTAQFSPALPFTVAPGGLIELSGFNPFFSGQPSNRMGVHIFFEESCLDCCQ